MVHRRDDVPGLQERDGLDLQPRLDLKAPFLHEREETCHKLVAGGLGALNAALGRGLGELPQDLQVGPREQRVGHGPRHGVQLGVRPDDQAAEIDEHGGRAGEPRGEVRVLLRRGGRREDDGPDQRDVPRENVERRRGARESLREPGHGVVAEAEPADAVREPLRHQVLLDGCVVRHAEHGVEVAHVDVEVL